VLKSEAGTTIGWLATPGCQVTQSIVNAPSQDPVHGASSIMMGIVTGNGAFAT
jgi:hypothetical protein